jgi:hypothetical protein
MCCVIENIGSMIENLAALQTRTETNARDILVGMSGRSYQPKGWFFRCSVKKQIKCSKSVGGTYPEERLRFATQSHNLVAMGGLEPPTPTL